MYGQFSDRGYTRETMRKIFYSVICCTTYTPLSYWIKDIIRDVLNMDLLCTTLFRDSLSFTHSKARNIREMLVSADTFDLSKLPCKHLDSARDFILHHHRYEKIRKFRHTVSEKEYEINKFITCSSYLVIY